MSVERFLTGKPETQRKLNLLVDAIKSLQSLNGDIFIRAANTPAGTTVRLNFPAVLERVMKNLGSSGGGTSSSILRRAFVKTTPGATTTLICFLDIDTTGEEVNVECTIYGGGNLNEAHPSFVDGDELWVAYNVIAGEWQNVTRIDGSEECVV